MILGILSLSIKIFSIFTTFFILFFVYLHHKSVYNEFYSRLRMQRYMFIDKYPRI
nr:MAG TPA: hypothetical protein [Caudoviricetes sp.]